MIYLQLYLQFIIISSCLVVAQSHDIIINELLASNSRTNYDPDYRNYNDWIEIYNNSDSSINLNGYYVTDDLSNPTKWLVTDDLIVEGKSYYLLWANGINTTKHTNFKLNKEGEQVGIFSPNGVVIDAITFDKQITDVSYGRNPNNQDEWLYFSEPTPRSINNSSGLLIPQKVLNINSYLFLMSNISL